MKPPKLDRLDLKILATLQRDGRITNQKLADTIGLSASPCLERVRRLEAAGYIRRYAALLDIERLSGAVTVFADISLKNHERETVARFERALADMPQIVECFEVSGTRDYLAHFVCPDIKTYHALTDDLLKRSDLGIAHVASRIVLRVVKEFNGYPLPQRRNQATG